MSVPSVLKGQFLSVGVDPQGDGTFTTICGLTTRTFSETAQTSDEYLRDCDDPTAVAFRALNITGLSYGITGNGLYNRAQADLLRNLIGRIYKYRFFLSEDAQDVVDSGYYEGNFGLVTRTITGADGSNTTADFTWASDGVITFFYGSDLIILDQLDVTPSQFPHGSSQTLTIAGTTAGSTLAVTSSDSTAITVTGAGTTRTATGNFATAGNKTLTMVETLTSASNSPKTSRVVVNAT